MLGSAVIAVLKQIGGLIYDYNAFRLPYWRSTPPIVVTGELTDTRLLRNVFADPLSFDPEHSDDVETSIGHGSAA